MPRILRPTHIKGGMPMGFDGKGHPNFSHNASTLRLTCPFFHQLPRPAGPDDPNTWIRALVVPEPGNILVARDFSGIEAVLVGYEAGDEGYTRLARRDVHSYYTAYALHELEGKIPANDLPLLSWDDEKLFRRLAEIKKEYKQDRNSLYKHLVHASNFGQSPKGAQQKILEETGVAHPVPRVAKVMEIYHELFPSIRVWHETVRNEASDNTFLRNAFGYRHAFYRVYAWKKEFGKWKRDLGDDAEAALAFKPQSNAAGIIKEAILRIYFDHFEEAGQYLRLQIHDEIFGESPEDRADRFDQIMTEEMERPIPQMPLPWNPDENLVVLSEGKRGYRWSEMH